MSRLVIEAGKTELGYWADLWRFRELFFFLSWRDILVRYKQTVIGVLWAILRPLINIVILSFIFGTVAKLPPDGLPYAVMVCAGTMPWQLFATSLNESSSSLINSGPMLSKIYFPRLIIPASSVMVSFFDFLISLFILAGYMVWYHVVPDWRILALPAFTLLAFFASFGAGLWLAALNVKYRDFRYVIPVLVQIGVYVTPVGFASSVILKRLVPYHLEWAYLLNPMTGVINGFRWSIGGNAGVTMDWTSLWYSIAVVLIVSVTGLRHFRSTEQNFADII